MRIRYFDTRINSVLESLVVAIGSEDYYVQSGRILKSVPRELVVSSEYLGSDPETPTVLEYTTKKIDEVDELDSSLSDYIRDVRAVMH